MFLFKNTSLSVFVGSKFLFPKVTTVPAVKIQLHIVPDLSKRMKVIRSDQ
jgi:hypothetical protein